MRKTSKSAHAAAIAPFETSTNQRIASAASTAHTHRRFPSALHLLTAKFSDLSFKARARTEAHPDFANRKLYQFPFCLSRELFLLIIVHLIVERATQRPSRAAIQTNPK